MIIITIIKAAHYAIAMLRSGWWKLRGYSTLTDGAEWARRQEICRQCPRYDDLGGGLGGDLGGECSICGCPVEAKTALASESCPKRFWLSVKRKKGTI